MLPTGITCRLYYIVHIIKTNTSSSNLSSNYGIVITAQNATLGHEIWMWDLMSNCILQERHLFILLLVMPILAHNYLSTQQSQGSRMWASEAHALICHAYYSTVFRCLQSPLFISHSSLTSLVLWTKKHFCSLHKLCIRSWIIYSSQRGPSISHYSVPSKGIPSITIHIRKAELPSNLLGKKLFNHQRKSHTEKLTNSLLSSMYNAAIMQCDQDKSLGHHLCFGKEWWSCVHLVMGLAKIQTRRKLHEKCMEPHDRIHSQTAPNTMVCILITFRQNTICPEHWKNTRHWKLLLLWSPTKKTLRPVCSIQV
jgi:hypothetical protein